MGEKEGCGWIESIVACFLFALALLLPILVIEGSDLFGDIAGPRPTVRQIPSEEDEIKIKVVIHGGWREYNWPYEQNLGFYTEGGARIRHWCREERLYRGLPGYPTAITCKLGLSGLSLEGTYLFGGKWEKRISFFGSLLTPNRNWVSREAYTTFRVDP